MINMVLRKQLGLIDFETSADKCIYIGRLPSPFSNEKNNYIAAEDFFIKDGYLINRIDSLKNGISDGMPEQFEMPLTGIKWMIETIEQSFETQPSSGGLAKNTMHVDACINDERLRIMYGVSIGGEGIGGYTVVNTSRSSYILPEASQQFSMTVDIWRDFGRSFFTALERRIEVGEFN